MREPTAETGKAGPSASPPHHPHITPHLLTVLLLGLQPSTRHSHPGLEKGSSFINHLGNPFLNGHASLFGHKPPK